MRTTKTAVDTPKGGKEKALLGLIDETVALFLQLQKDIERIHPAGKPSGARRTLLLSTYREGPRTVPQMARARGASRQYTRTVVNPLVDEGYLEFADNPAHKRSRFVQLTGKGKAAVEQMNREEIKFLRQMKIDLKKERLFDAAGTLHQVRKMMESDDWRRSNEPPRRK